MIARIFLGLQGLIFIPYGLYCLVSPEMLADAAGVTATSTTGRIELQAMYGGVQTAVGVLCAMAAINAGLRRSALVALVFLFAGLAVTRVSLGLMLSDFTAYTTGAMVFESASLVISLWLLRRDDAPQVA